MNDQPLFKATKVVDVCPECGATLQIKKGKKGLFMGCTHYPQCTYIQSLQGQSIGKIIKKLSENCPQCHHPLVIRQGSFGMFIGCSYYPNCDYLISSESKQTLKVSCPSCHKGNIIERTNRYGRLFYACNQYPQCRFLLKKKPYVKSCPICGKHIAIIKKQQGKNIEWQCANPQCLTVFKEENEY